MNSQVFRFDVRVNRLAASSPQSITEVFPAVLPGNHPVGNLDAAYFSYTHNTVFLLKGSWFWRMVSGRDRRLMPRRDVEQQWFDICDVHSSSLRTARRRWSWSQIWRRKTDLIRAPTPQIRESLTFVQLQYNSSLQRFKFKGIAHPKMSTLRITQD